MHKYHCTLRYISILYCIQSESVGGSRVEMPTFPDEALNGWRLTVHAPRLFRIITSTHQGPCLLSSDTIQV